MEDMIHGTVVFHRGGHIAQAVDDGKIAKHGTGFLLISHMGDDGDLYRCGAEGAHQHGADQAGGTGDQNGLARQLLPVGKRGGDMV